MKAEESREVICASISPASMRICLCVSKITVAASVIQAQPVKPVLKF